VSPMVAAFAAIYLFWGGTFLAIRYAVADFPPLLTIAVRCLAGALLVGAWAGRRGGCRCWRGAPRFGAAAFRTAWR
jgi:drug/metabolite transporter (DMT)-like permease